MPLDWSPFVEIVRRHQRFLLTCHVRPDGDALGSTLALGETLRELSKDVRMVVASAIPPRYDFLREEHFKVERFELPGKEYRDAQVVIVIDTGTWNQLGDFGTFLRDSSAVKVVIDHHVTQDDLGALRLVDTTAEAAGRLSWEAIRALGATPSPRAALALYTALAMDTGWFRHGNTTAATFRLAAELVDAGARPDKLYDVLFEQNSMGRVKLIGRVIDRLRLADNGQVAYSEVHVSDYESVGATPQETEDLVNYTRSLTGVEVGVLFLEQPRGGVKVSLRSREQVDVARVAEQFGGGGHRQASGATFMTTLAEARQKVLTALTAALARN